MNVHFVALPTRCIAMCFSREYEKRKKIVRSRKMFVLHVSFRFTLSFWFVHVHPLNVQKKLFNNNGNGESGWRSRHGARRHLSVSNVRISILASASALHRRVNIFKMQLLNKWCKTVSFCFSRHFEKHLCLSLILVKWKTYSFVFQQNYSISKALKKKRIFGQIAENGNEKNDWEIHGNDRTLVSNGWAREWNFWRK